MWSFPLCTTSVILSLWFQSCCSVIWGSICGYHGVHGYEWYSWHCLISGSVKNMPVNEMFPIDPDTCKIAQEYWGTVSNTQEERKRGKEVRVEILGQILTSDEFYMHLIPAALVWMRFWTNLLNDLTPVEDEYSIVQMLPNTRGILCWPLLARIWPLYAVKVALADWAIQPLFFQSQYIA